MLLRKAGLMRVILKGHRLGVRRRYCYAVSGCELEATRGVSDVSVPLERGGHEQCSLMINKAQKVTFGSM
jgi:hypothetical protein